MNEANTFTLNFMAKNIPKVNYFSFVNCNYFEVDNVSLLYRSTKGQLLLLHFARVYKRIACVKN